MTAWKQGLGMAGVIAAMVAVLSGRSWVVWTAIALLGASVTFRVLERIRRRRSASARDSLSDHGEV